MPTLKANQIKINYEIKGEGPPLTMIMGMSCSLRQWQWMTDKLSETFQVITFDNRGAGMSDKPDIEYTTELMAEDIHSLLSQLGINKSHIFGISFGGMIAQRFALMFPETTDSLVLGATMPSWDHFPPSSATIEALQTSSLAPVSESVQIVMELFFTHDFLQNKPDDAAKIKEIMIREKETQSLDILYRQMGAAMAHNMLEDIQKITAPTLVICGDGDLIAPLDNSRFLSNEIPNSKLIEMPATYHAFWIERSDEACAAIKDFLSHSL